MSPETSAERGAVERPRDDAGEQGRLQQHQQRGGQPDGGVGSQQDPRGPRSAEEARVEGAHGTQGAGGSPGLGASASSGLAPGVSPAIRARKT